MSSSAVPEQAIQAYAAAIQHSDIHEPGIRPRDENRPKEGGNGWPVIRALVIVEEPPEAGRRRRQPRNVLRLGRRRLKEALATLARERDDGGAGSVVVHSKPKGRELAGEDGLRPAGETL